MDPTTTATIRPFSFWALVALLACLAIAASWFLPWLALGAAERSDLGVGEGDLRVLEDAARKEGPEAEAMLDLVGRLRAGEAATGREWLSLLSFAMESAAARASFEPREERAFRVAYLSLAALPWLAAALALALLLGRLRVMGSLPIACLFALGLLVGGLGGLVWLGASMEARDRAAENLAHLGLGLKALAAGGLACLLSSLLGVTSRTWWRGWGLGLLLAAGLAVGVVLYVRG